MSPTPLENFVAALNHGRMTGYVGIAGDQVVTEESLETADVPQPTVRFEGSINLHNNRAYYNVYVNEELILEDVPPIALRGHGASFIPVWEALGITVEYDDLCIEAR